MIKNLFTLFKARTKITPKTPKGLFAFAMQQWAEILFCRIKTTANQF
jgi:hypothetical protein